MTNTALQERPDTIRVLALIGLIFLIGVGLPLIIALISAIPDMIRYVRLRNM